MIALRLRHSLQKVGRFLGKKTLCRCYSSINRYSNRNWNPCCSLALHIIDNNTKMYRFTKIDFLFLSILTRYYCITSCKTFSVTEMLTQFFNKKELFGSCSFQLFSHSTTAAGQLYPSRTSWDDKIAYLIRLPHIHEVTVTTTTVPSNRNHNVSTGFKSYQQPKIISYSRRCSLVMIVVNTSEFTDIRELEMINTLTAPILNPPTVRNRDSYLILVEKEPNIISNSKLMKSLKFKLVLLPFNQIPSSSLAEGHDLLVSILKPCPLYYTERDLCPAEFPSEDIKRSLFIDQEKDFFGTVLRLSTTTKVPQLLEMKTVKGTNNKNIYVPIGGLYSIVLAELSARLNFTYEIVPSSGNGSTG